MGLLEDRPDEAPPADFAGADATEAFFRRDERKTRTERFEAKAALALACVARARGDLFIDGTVRVRLRCPGSGSSFSAAAAERMYVRFPSFAFLLPPCPNTSQPRPAWCSYIAWAQLPRRLYPPPIQSGVSVLCFQSVCGRCIDAFSLDCPRSTSQTNSSVDSYPC